MTTTPTRGPYRTGIKRRLQILQAAAEVFGQFGYAGGSLKQIAQQVGVTPAALIRHFDTKEGLLIAVLEYWSTETSRATDESATGLSVTGVDYFRAMAEVMKYHVTHRGLLELYLTLSVEASDPGHPARAFVTERNRTLIDESIAALTEATKRGEIRPLTSREVEWEVRHLLATMDGLEMQWLLDQSLDLVGAFEYIFATFLERWQHPA